LHDEIESTTQAKTKEDRLIHLLNFVIRTPP